MGSGGKGIIYVGNYKKRRRRMRGKYLSYQTSTTTYLPGYLGTYLMTFLSEEDNGYLKEKNT